MRLLSRYGDNIKPFELSWNGRKALRQSVNRYETLRLTRRSGDFNAEDSRESQWMEIQRVSANAGVLQNLMHPSICSSKSLDTSVL